MDEINKHSLPNVLKNTYDFIYYLLMKLIFLSKIKKKYGNRFGPPQQDTNSD